VSDRLDQFLSQHGFGSRSEVRGLVRSGAVTVDGLVCRDQARHLKGAAVAVRGEPVRPGAASATLIVHKPLGLACSNDPGEAPLLRDLYPAEFAHLPLEPAGRLDRETSGLIIVTSDGQLIHRLTNPKTAIAKRYRVRYRGRLSARAVERCAKGMLIEGDDQPTLPARLELHGEDEATLHLVEGRYHQVRKMIAALGGEVVRLHRDRIGRLDLPADLEPGRLRAATAPELAALFASDG
jgi:16S rRNA pseudouridine516 synthase